MPAWTKADIEQKIKEMQDAGRPDAVGYFQQMLDRMNKRESANG